MKNNEKKSIDAQGLLNTLQYHPQDHIVEPLFEDSEKIFIKHLQEFLTLHTVIIRGTKAKGELGFAIRYLISGCFNDLICAFHLAKYGYYIQSFAIYRRIYETTDLVELFTKQPEFVKIWIKGGKEAINQLRPGVVREKIGKAKVDPLYSLLCEQGSHPTYQSHPSVTYIEKNITAKTNKIVFRIGGAFFNRPQSFFTQLFSLQSFFLILCQILAGFKLPENLIKPIINEISALHNDTTVFMETYWTEYVKMSDTEEKALKSAIYSMKESLNSFLKIYK